MGQPLNRHKDQPYYYLKLQGMRVNTADLWGSVLRVPQPASSDGLLR